MAIDRFRQNREHSTKQNADDTNGLHWVSWKLFQARNLLEQKYKKERYDELLAKKALRKTRNGDTLFLPCQTPYLCSVYWTQWLDWDVYLVRWSRNAHCMCMIYQMERCPQSFSTFILIWTWILPQHCDILQINRLNKVLSPWNCYDFVQHFVWT